MRTNAARHFAACAALCVVLGAAACRKGAEAQAGADNGDRRFPLTGRVISADPAKKVIVVSHEEVAGYMPAMTMDFPVSAGDAAAATAGERIRAELVVSRDNTVRLEHIWPDDKASVDNVGAGARMLHQDTFEKGKGAFREVGEAVPQFVLFDQNARVVDSARFRGKQVMVNFIYSRCPVANMCPLSTTKMAETQRLAREAGIPNAEFVSITLDPAYDTPGVLHDYAADRHIDTANFSFLTGPEAAIQDLLTQFGVIAEFKDGILNHTLATILVDEKGVIRYRADGSAWDPKEFVGRMHK
ncbi:MAG TPA: SCO family protein [Opitutaceae bacterium]|nr:SCO family protein [Opitutaceae bacterium]